MRAYGDREHWETPYVVRLHRFHPLAAPQPVFTFTHPNNSSSSSSNDPSAAPDNNRGCELTFERSVDEGAGELHGFAGYFEAVLYSSRPPGGTGGGTGGGNGGEGDKGDKGEGEGASSVTLSTRPETHTPGMLSWFPIFFPLRDPLLLAPGAPVTARMWRVCGPQRVWYEWAASAPGAGSTAIHNPAGRSYWVGL